MKAFYATQFVLPLPPGHRFPMGKYQRLRDRLAQECPGLVLDQAEPTADADLALAHAPAYIDAVARGALTLRGYDRVLRVAWTLCDLVGGDSPTLHDVGRALFMKRGVVA